MRKRAYVFCTFGEVPALMSLRAGGEWFYKVANTGTLAYSHKDQNYYKSFPFDTIVGLRYSDLKDSLDKKRRAKNHS